jgi:dipeptidyl aminopeptidase/acylaminoacyl peptidase
MNADGGDQTRLLNDQPFDSYSDEPAWSPDGARIAFTRGRDISDQLIPDEIYLMNADGSSPENLTKTKAPAEYEQSPAWSPDGLRIAFARASDINVMNADGSAIVNITNTIDSDEFDPSWQPLSPTGCAGSVVSPTSQSFEANGGTGGVDVTAGSECGWTALSFASWITITSGNSSGNGRVGYSLAVNTSTSSRTAGLIVAGHLVIVTQLGVPVRIISASVEGNRLFIVGENFDPGASSRRPRTILKTRWAH